MTAVIVTLPHEIARGTQISVVTAEDIASPQVMVRAHSTHAWVPISHIEGHVEVRPS